MELGKGSLVAEQELVAGVIGRTIHLLLVKQLTGISWWWVELQNESKVDSSVQKLSQVLAVPVLWMAS